METFLDAPVPYIMGLLRRTHDIELYKRGTVAIVDIDNGELVRIFFSKTSSKPGISRFAGRLKKSRSFGSCFSKMHFYMKYN